MKIAVGIIDDQQLFLKSLATLISSFEEFTVVIEALNGQELLNKLKTAAILPDILLIDVNMPILNGQETVKKLVADYPSIKTVALSIKDDDQSILGMLRAGSAAYLLKDVHPTELKRALLSVHEVGYYNTDALGTRYRRMLLNRAEEAEIKLNEREKAFLKLACSDFTYKEIASKMFLSEKTIDGYRESLFQKLNVRSRVGMALEAIKLHLVEI